MTKISAIIITKNEEEHIEECLKSLLCVVDEIVVVDSFSTDRTEEICRKYTSRFYTNTFIDYASQRNFAVNLAQHEYILALDADEELSDKLQEKLLHLKPNLDANSYHFNRLNNYCGKWIKYGTWYNDKVIRLSKKEYAVWKGSVHETIDISKSVFMPGNILHYTASSMKKHFDKLCMYANMWANERYKLGKKASIWTICLWPSVEFLRNYILRLGFLDGYYGYVIARASAQYKFQKYAILRSLRINKKN
ncbi:MAG: glycosyltransferase family 2 protein [Bacteroidales bacterium]